MFGFVRRRGGLGPWRAQAREARVTLAMMAANVLVAAPVITLVASGINAAAAATEIRLVDPALWREAPKWIVVICAVIAGDFVGYWRHRLEHSPLLWPAHAVHHSDLAMTWLTLERFHPINTVTTYAIDTAALAALGFPLEAIIANGVVRHWYGYWIHTDAPWTYGPFGRVFVSPAMHGWHHAADPRVYGTNFATVLAIWDQMFGTFHLPGPRPAALGVEGVTGTPALAQLAYPARPSAYRFGAKSAENMHAPKTDDPSPVKPVRGD